MKVMSFENDIAKRWGTETYIVVGEQDKMRETKTWLAEIKFKAVKLIIPMGGARRVRQGTSSQYQYCYLDLVIWYYLSAQPIQYK